METPLGSFVECVLTAVLVVCFTSCSNPGPPNPLPTQVTHLLSSRTTSPHAHPQNIELQRAEEPYSASGVSSIAFRLTRTPI